MTPDDPKQSCNIQCGFDVYRLVPFKMRNQSQFILLCGVRPTYNKCFITAIFPLNIRIISYTPAYSIPRNKRRNRAASFFFFFYFSWRKSPFSLVFSVAFLLGVKAISAIHVMGINGGRLPIRADQHIWFPPFNYHPNRSLSKFSVLPKA